MWQQLLANKEKFSLELLAIDEKFLPGLLSNGENNQGLHATM